ncbi:MAG: tRNA (adenosine(37)-N6)-dimethylallyltransferase MiaA [Pirellulaceae bacterium]
MPSDTYDFSRHWFLTGPTASGKSAVGLRLAEAIDAEIIALDSMSLYRGMDIGTAKPTKAQQETIPHHLVDVLDPTEESSIARYLQMAQKAATEIEARGKRVLFVGGTPLYLKALLRGMSEGPPPDTQLRSEMEAEAERGGSEPLHARLKLVDPLSANQIHPHDTRRIIRALEVYRTTGAPISHQQLDFEDSLAPEDCRAFWLSWPRPELHVRINARVDQMLEAGLLAEVERLTQTYGKLSTTALQAVGYAEIIAHQQGEMALPLAVERIKARTRQFAKRQCTWFRSLGECRQVPLETEGDLADAHRQILNMADSATPPK